MSSLLNINMTSKEAQKVLWTAYEGKTMEERESIAKKCGLTIETILKRELEEAHYQDIMTS